MDYRLNTVLSVMIRFTHPGLSSEEDSFKVLISIKSILCIFICPSCMPVYSGTVCPRRIVYIHIVNIALPHQKPAKERQIFQRYYLLFIYIRQNFVSSLYDSLVRLQWLVGTILSDTRTRHNIEANPSNCTFCLDFYLQKVKFCIQPVRHFRQITIVLLIRQILHKKMLLLIFKFKIFNLYGRIFLSTLLRQKT